MSQENVEIATRMLRWIEERNEEGFVECFHPDCEFLLPRNLLEGGSYKGYDGVKQAFADIYDAWDDVRFEVEDIRTTASQVVIVSRTTNVGKGAGPPVTYPTAYLYEIREGTIVYFRPYRAIAEALKAVGLCGVADVARERGDRRVPSGPTTLATVGLPR